MTVFYITVLFTRSIRMAGGFIKGRFNGVHNASYLLFF
jgi:hypothetical protein